MAKQRLNDEEALDLIRKLGHGEVLSELAEALGEAEHALEETGKPAQVGLKITIKPNGGRKRLVSGAVTTKLPKVAETATYLFVTDAGQYVENDPDQRQLDLREAKGKVLDIRDTTSAAVPDRKSQAAGDK